MFQSIAKRYMIIVSLFRIILINFVGKLNGIIDLSLGLF